MSDKKYSKWSKYRWLGRSPLTIVELIIAVSTMIGGLYVLSPLLQVSIIKNGASPLVQSLGSEIGLFLFGLAFTISGLLMLVGFFKRSYRLRSAGLFMNILCRMYVMFGTFLIQGLLPLTWLGSFTVMVIAIVCWLVVRGMIVRQGLESDAT